MFLLVRPCAELMQTQGQGHISKSWDLPLNFVSGPLSPQPFERFSLNITQMFRSVRRCAEPMTQLPRLKVKVTLQGHGIYPWILFELFLSARRCAEPMNQLCRLKVRSLFKVMEFTLHVRSISPEPFELHPNAPLSETMCRAYDSASRLKVKLTLQGHRILWPFRLLSCCR